MGKERRARLLDFNQERDSLVRDVAARVCEAKVQAAQKNPQHSLEYVLNEAAFCEIERLTKFGPDEGIGEIGSLGYWRRVARRARGIGEGEKERELRRLAQSYAADIAGNFDPKVYRFANKVVPMGLSLLFNTQANPNGRRAWRRLTDRISIEGPLDDLRALANEGTLVVAPTHLSNLDSIVIGWALMEAGLPPVTYGAGKNLFSNPLLSYFMQNLGAYKVDRRIQHGLYKDCLKMYSQVLLERGFHSLFFPGGTRSRSGDVESRLKLGLLGTSLTAYVNNLMAGRVREKIFIVPMTLNFNLVLEADGLINDHLRAVGREHYLLPDDPFDKPSEVLRFLTKVAAMKTTMVVRMGDAMDLLGNRVDATGQAYDRQGRAVETASYFEVSPGEYGFQEDRDRQYTKQAGDALVDAFRTNTVLMPTQFLSYVLFEAACRQFPGMPLVRVLRFGEGVHVPWQEVNAEAERLQKMLVERAERGEIHILDTIRTSRVPELVDEALRALRMYHASVPARATGQGIELGNMNLLYYYSNRLRVLDGL